MADDLEKAILFSFDQTGRVDPALKARAEAYCTEFKKSPANWVICVEHFGTTQYGEVKFWCLQAVLEILQNCYPSMAVSNRSQLKHKLLCWMGDEVGMASFLKNKLAQILVYIVQVEYPEQWPSFFQDLLSLLPRGAHAVEMFCRILIAIDDDVISLEMPRSQEESRRSMHVKDAMRELCISDLAEAWFQLVSAYKDTQPELAAMVLHALKRYVSWIDINLVANNRFIPLLFALPNSPCEELQAASCGCINEILSKRMDALLKLQLIQQLGIVQVCKSWIWGMPQQHTESEIDPDLAENYANLLATLASELLDCWKRAENGVTSIAAVGLAVDPEAVKEAQEATGAALGLLSDLFPAIISVLHGSIDACSMLMAPFLSAYIQRLKRLPQLPEQQRQHILLTLDGIAQCLMYPKNVSDAELNCEAGPVIEEIEDRISSKRRELFTLFRNIARISPSDTLPFVAAKINAAITDPKTSLQEVEVSVTLLHQLGEGASDEYQKPGYGLLGQMAAALMQAGANIPHIRHRLVAFAILETFVRYCRVVTSQPSLLPVVLQAMLDERGMGHFSTSVSTRACYLFQRLVKQIRSSLGAMVETILKGLEPHLSKIAATPINQNSQQDAPVLSGPKGTHGRGPTGVVSYLDDRMYAFEAAGILLGGEDLDAAKQLTYVQSLLWPLVQQIERNIDGASRGNAQQVQLIQHALVAISHFSKGFTHHVATKSRPDIGKLLQQVVDHALNVPAAIPGNKPLRARVVALVHRNIEVLGASILPSMQRTFDVLMREGMDAEDLADVMGLLGQLICRFKENATSICEYTLGTILSVTHLMLPPSWDWSGRVGTGIMPGQIKNPATDATGNAEELREKAELQKTYYGLLHSLCQNNLAATLTHLDSSVLERCMQALVSGASMHVDPSVRKICVQILNMLTCQWLSSLSDTASWEIFPGFRHWVVDHIAIDTCIIGILQGGLDLQDASVSSLVGEVACLLRIVYERCGTELIASLGRVGWPDSISNPLCNALQDGRDEKDLKTAVKSVMQQIQTLQRQAAGTK